MKYFETLGNRDVFSAKVSDHQPVIHDNVLFWNVMMQGKKRGEGYNNGFGLVESDNDYLDRLRKVADVIAEIVEKNPTLIAVSLCEGPISTLKGPIKSAAVTTFVNALHNHEIMGRFSSLPHSPMMPSAHDWGLMMFADMRYTVNPVPTHFVMGSVMYKNLGNRFQIWQLSHQEEVKYLALAHFPFAGNEYVTDQKDLSIQGKMYIDYLSFVLKEYEGESFILCADFNLNPYLIGEWKARELDKVPGHNSILLSTPNHEVSKVTVDGILLSSREKQRFYQEKYHPGLFGRLLKEHTLSLSISSDLQMGQG